MLLGVGGAFGVLHLLVPLSWFFRWHPLGLISRLDHLLCVFRLAVGFCLKFVAGRLLRRHIRVVVGVGDRVLSRECLHRDGHFRQLRRWLDRGPPPVPEATYGGVVRSLPARCRQFWARTGGRHGVSVTVSGEMSNTVV